MKRVENEEFQKIKCYFDEASKVAASATCMRAKCGTVIVKDNVVIGQGYNSPALNKESQRTCGIEFNLSIKPKYDKTCCIHAEWRAILSALKNVPDKVPGSTLYFMRIDSGGNFTDAGEPFCTVCSRLSMESGIKEFVLYNNNGADIYPSDEYNLKSYKTYVNIE